MKTKKEKKQNNDKTTKLTIDKNSNQIQEEQINENEIPILNIDDDNDKEIMWGKKIHLQTKNND